jgi:acyl-CoA thioesterase-1
MPPFTLDELNFRIQFTHLEKLNADLPGMDEATIAHIFGVDLPVYQEIRGSFTQRACHAAEELLEEIAFRENIARLPFRAGAKVVAIGDSITDDYQSWFEIFRRVLELARPQDGLHLVNAAISGDTTNHLITRFLGVVQEQPDWILCMIGTNDARLHGLKPSKPLVNLDETAQNLRMVRNFAKTQSTARWLWITPSTVIEKQITDHWFLGPLQLAWRNLDLAAVAELVRQQPEPVVDLQSLFGAPQDPSLLLEDGLHPSIGGQKVILRAVVEKLAEYPNFGPPR